MVLDLISAINKKGSLKELGLEKELYDWVDQRMDRPYPPQKTATKSGL